MFEDRGAEEIWGPVPLVMVSDSNFGVYKQTKNNFRLSESKSGALENDVKPLWHKGFCDDSTSKSPAVMDNP